MNKFMKFEVINLPSRKTTHGDYVRGVYIVGSLT